MARQTQQNEGSRPITVVRLLYSLLHNAHLRDQNVEGPTVSANSSQSNLGSHQVHSDRARELWTYKRPQFANERPLFPSNQSESSLPYANPAQVSLLCTGRCTLTQRSLQDQIQATLQSIMKSIAEQSKSKSPIRSFEVHSVVVLASESNAGYQKQVGEYLQRFDAYLKSEQTARSTDWQAMTKAVSSLQQQVEKLAEAPRRSFSASKKERQVSDDSGKSTLRKSRQSAPPKEPNESIARGRAPGSKAPTLRKRSISLPKINTSGFASVRLCV